MKEESSKNENSSTAEEILLSKKEPEVSKAPVAPPRPIGLPTQKPRPVMRGGAPRPTRPTRPMRPVMLVRPTSNPIQPSPQKQQKQEETK